VFTEQLPAFHGCVETLTIEITCFKKCQLAKSRATTRGSCEIRVWN